MLAEDDLLRLGTLRDRVLAAGRAREVAAADEPLLAELRELQKRVTEAALLDERRD